MDSLRSGLTRVAFFAFAGVVAIVLCCMMTACRSDPPNHMGDVFGMINTAKVSVVEFYETNGRLPADIREAGYDGSEDANVHRMFPYLHYLPVTEKRFVVWVASEPDRDRESRGGPWDSELGPPPPEPDYVKESKGRKLAELVTTSSSASDCSRWLVEHPHGWEYVRVCEIADGAVDVICRGNFRPSIENGSTTASAIGTTETKRAGSI